MDKVTTFMDEKLEKTKRKSDDKILTKTMINNYTKSQLLPASNKKKYSKEHILLLIFIYYFKSTLSIQDIQYLLQPLIQNYTNTNSKQTELQFIYDKIISLEKQQLETIKKDINDKLTIALDAFPKTENNDHDYLTIFSFISMLNFETYIKKQLVEKLIDQYFVTENVAGGK